MLAFRLTVIYTYLRVVEVLEDEWCDVYKIIRSEKKTAVLITHDISEAISLADKIVVLTKRPATVLAEHVLSFPENEPLKRRENKLFSAWFEKLWGELNV